MRKILFLDFDGVLHPDGVGLFSKRSLFEQYLLKMAEIEIVISSSWRQDHSLEQLRSYFSVSLRDRISDITPTLDNGYDSGGRQREIEAFLDTAGLNSANTSWIALDDMPFFFDSDCSFLIMVDPNEGFTDVEGHVLEEWYTNGLKPG